jgi:DNA-binding XRE family transcriptional regulator
MTPFVGDLALYPGTTVPQTRGASGWVKVTIIAPLVLATASLGTGAVWVTGLHDPAAEVVQNYIDYGTPSGVAIDGYSIGAGRQSAAALVRDIYDRSGLTWGELAQVFGVSRRAVHHWETGQRPSEIHFRRVEAFNALISSFRGLEPQQMKAALLSPGIYGESRLTRFERETHSQPHVPLSILTLGDFLEGGSERATSIEQPSRRSSLSPSSLSPRSGT